MTNPLQADVVGKSRVYEAAYETIRQGAPGLSDATCAVLARSINMKVSLLAAPVLPDRGWRPIEGAPRDERVLIFRPSDFLEDRIFTVFLDEDDWWSVHDGKHDHHLRGNQPTHWMPLPDAPAEGAE